MSPSGWTAKIAADFVAPPPFKNMTVGEYIEVLKRFDPSLPLIDRYQFHRDGHFQFVGVGDPYLEVVAVEQDNGGGARIYRLHNEEDSAAEFPGIQALVLR